MRNTFTVGTGGVTANTLVNTDGSNPAKVIEATSGGFGIAQSTVSAAGSVEVAGNYGDVTQCLADNSFTEGDFAIPGASTTDYCRDSGQSAKQNILTTQSILGKIYVSVGSNCTTPAVFTVRWKVIYLGS